CTSGWCGHPLHARASITVDELREERLILPRTGCEIPGFFEQQRGKGGHTVRYQVSEGATILAMVREGLGITILLRSMLPDKLEAFVAFHLTHRGRYRSDLLCGRLTRHPPRRSCLCTRHLRGYKGRQQWPIKVCSSTHALS